MYITGNVKDRTWNSRTLERGCDYHKKSRTHLEQAKERCPPRAVVGVSKVERVAEEPEGGGAAREAARTALCPPGRAPGHTWAAAALPPRPRGRRPRAGRCWRWAATRPRTCTTRSCSSTGPQEPACKTQGSLVDAIQTCTLNEPFNAAIEIICFRYRFWRICTCKKTWTIKQNYLATIRSYKKNQIENISLKNFSPAQPKN